MENKIIYWEHIIHNEFIRVDMENKNMIAEAMIRAAKQAVSQAIDIAIEDAAENACVSGMGFFKVVDTQSILDRKEIIKKQLDI